MALTAAGSPLVAGSSMENAMTIQPTQRVKVLRPFYFDKKLQEKDKELDLPRTFAIEVRDANKAEFVDRPVQKGPDSKPSATGLQTKTGDDPKK